MQLMALIGEQFDETEDICGIVASARQRGDKLALWTKTASNEAVQVGIESHSNSVISFDTQYFLICHSVLVCILIKGKVGLYSSLFSSCQYCQ